MSNVPNSASNPFKISIVCLLNPHFGTSGLPYNIEYFRCLIVSFPKAEYCIVLDLLIYLFIDILHTFIKSIHGEALIILFSFCSIGSSSFCFGISFETTNKVYAIDLQLRNHSRYYFLCYT